MYVLVKRVITPILTLRTTLIACVERATSVATRRAALITCVRHATSVATSLHILGDPASMEAISVAATVPSG
jgi:hypothetical protein